MLLSCVHNDGDFHYVKGCAHGWIMPSLGIQFWKLYGASLLLHLGPESLGWRRINWIGFRCWFSSPFLPMSGSSGSWSPLDSLWTRGGLTRAVLRDYTTHVDVENYFTRLDSWGAPGAWAHLHQFLCRILRLATPWLWWYEA